MVALNVPVPPVKPLSPGSAADLALVVKWIVPVYPNAVLLDASSAVTVKLNGNPACTKVGASTRKCVGPGVGVGASKAVLVVEIVRDQPEKLPVLSALSSTTYRLHVPFGLVPLKTERAELPDGGGAGPGNGSISAS